MPTSDTSSIRVTNIADQAWTCVADVAAALHIKNPPIWTRPLPRHDIKMLTTKTRGAPVTMGVVSFSGLLKLLLAGKTPVSRTVRNRLTTADVLSGDPARVLAGFQIEAWDGRPRHLRAVSTSEAAHVTG